MIANPAKAATKNPSENSSSTEQTRLVDSRTAARMLAISTRKLWSLWNSGRIPVVKIDAAVRFDTGDLERFIEQSKTAS